MKKLIYILLLLPTLGVAQQDYIVSQYMFNGMFLNPAYTGSNDLKSVTALYRKQWVKFDGAPSTQLVGFDMPIKGKNMGLALGVGNDRIGVSNQSDVFVNYGYHLKLNEKSKLSFGLRGGFSMYQAKVTDLTYWDSGDPMFEENLRSSFLPNFGFGAYYYADKYFAGISIPHLMNYHVGAIKASFDGAPSTVRHYYLHAGYIFGEGDFKYKPNFLIRYVGGAPVQADVNFSVLYKQLGWIGASFRTGDCIVGHVQVYAMPELKIGYAYDATLTDIRNYSQGSHEIMISYEFGKTEEHSVRFF